MLCRVLTRRSSWMSSTLCRVVVVISWLQKRCLYHGIRPNAPGHLPPPRSDAPIYWLTRSKAMLFKLCFLQFQFQLQLWFFSNHAESYIIFQVHFQHDSLLKAFSQPISLACCQLSTDWEHTFYVCLRCRSWQQVLGKCSQQWVFIGIRDSVGLAVSKISNHFSVHSVWHSDCCSRRMFHHVLC